jgi:hypothetical protein
MLDVQLINNVGFLGAGVMFASGVGGGTDDGSASTAVTLNLLPCIFHQTSLLIIVQLNSLSEKMNHISS